MDSLGFEFAFPYSVMVIEESRFEDIIQRGFGFWDVANNDSCQSCLEIFSPEGDWEIIGS